MLREREECILQLKDEIARLKGEKGKPKIKPSRLEPEKKAQGQQEETEEDATQDELAKKKRPGSTKRHKTASLPIHERGISKDSHIKTTTEGALLGAVITNGVSPKLGIMSDGAGQFRLLEHGLCWVHAERLINKLIAFTLGTTGGGGNCSRGNLGLISGFKSL